jgi:hypothetical protein
MTRIVDRQARRRIQALEEQAAQRNRELAEISSAVSRASRPLPSPAVPRSPLAPAREVGVVAVEHAVGQIRQTVADVEREGRQESSCMKSDRSLKSFLYTLKNPHNSPASKFALKAEGRDRAISCDSSWGPCFCDICVAPMCNTVAMSGSYLGFTYANDTGLDGRTVLTGSKWFTVKEIEVFEITD